ncbi:MAG: BsuBI/PstI family type II restriction endonuclease [Chitinophagales bacterium]
MNDKNYISLKKCKTFASKKPQLQELINHTLWILEAFGIPTNATSRRLERMAIVFLALADVKCLEDFSLAKDLEKHQRFLKTRDIIRYVNRNFQEKISSGSYDDIRRKDLKVLLLGNIVLKSNPNLATNDSTRGYGINPVYANLVRLYQCKNWIDIVKKQLANSEPISEILKRKRNLEKVAVLLPSGLELEFSAGKHNVLQKVIIENFLTRYGYSAKVLYVGDTADKYLHLDKKTLQELNFFDIAHEELPDIIAYSTQKKWLYLIEAVHSSGAIDEMRLLQLQKLTKHCKADIVYVTAFLDRKTFRKFVADIAWETEVWIADNPDHLIHFNGDKFLGPYSKS